MPETRGQQVIVLATVESPAALPEGFVDIDTLVEQEEQNPQTAAAIADGRKIVAEQIYGTTNQPFSYYRLLKGWSQKQLADKVGTSQPYIARLETGGVDPQVGTLRRIAEALEVSVSALLDALPQRK